MTRDPTERFSDRVDSYVRARPGYPAGVLDILEEVSGLTGPLPVADVGSGTGIFSRLLLDQGHTVYAVEPNAPMRQQAEASLGGNPRFHSVPGRAEATTLAAGSLDLAAAAQAFHWFEPAATRSEWRRILRPPGWALLVWNERLTTGSPFLEAFERFLGQWGSDYHEVRTAWVRGENLDVFFGEGAWSEHRLPNGQLLDLEGLIARVASSSYMPNAGPRLAPMLGDLERLFDEHQRDGKVALDYETRIYLGRLLG